MVCELQVNLPTKHFQILKTCSFLSRENSGTPAFSIFHTTGLVKQKRVYFAFVVVFCAFVAHFLCIFVHFCAFLLELRSLWNPRQTWRASGGSRRRENKQDGAFKLGRNTSGFVYVYLCLCICVCVFVFVDLCLCIPERTNKVNIFNWSERGFVFLYF